ncbi:enoyl-CoA hydratase/isomerase family protein [Halosolutus gelatinilyticus]|uniref:enoyl-CoA hydratase/isomerase family protein n=1 Tax=Halosolutus gelatinilyticus TaxID=2931975 RepID=UPI001FF51841|nr:enoyl-CoA hydratase-related protein [Halosolutus gelatinilyticus]
MDVASERIHDLVRVEHLADDAVARLVMEEGESPMNVFQPSKVEAMATAVEVLAGDVDCLVLYGEPVFSAGADLRSVKQMPQEMRSAKIDTIAAASNRFIRSVREFPAPVISAVTGVAAGGGLGFALASDLISMHEDAVFDTAYSRIGLTPDNATPFFLVRTVGPHRARELLFDPDPISAVDAVDLGLANERYEGSESAFLESVTEDAIRYANGPTETYAQTKRLLDTAFDGALDQHLEQERSTIKRMSDSDLFDEGLAAFFEKRQPDWG